MRSAVISVLAIAGTAFATNPASQISDGQVQWGSSSAAAPPAYSTPAVSSVAPVSSQAPPSYGSSAPASPPSYSTSSVSVPAVVSSSPAGAISSAPSYPAGNGTVPTGTGKWSTGKPTILTTKATGTNPGGPISGVSSSPAAATGTNAAGVVEAQIGLTGAALAGVIALLA